MGYQDEMLSTFQHDVGKAEKGNHGQGGVDGQRGPQVRDISAVSQAVL